MSKAKWIVDVKVDDPKEYVKPENFVAYKEDYGYDVSLEISVVREDNKHGIKSCGWGGENKIILCDTQLDGEEEDVKGTIKLWKERAQAIADALNEKGL